MHFVDLQNTDKIKKNYEIKGLLNCRVNVEPIRKTRVIPQCARCMSYGHTKKYYNMIPRCIRCSKSGHINNECTKSIEEPPKCALCGRAHPANYKGCKIYKELQAKRFPSYDPKHI